MSIRELQHKGVTDLMSTLKMIDINPIEICNRSCSFCPRSDKTLYANSKYKISLETSRNVAKHLKEINFSGAIIFAGFGEPLLHKRLEECIKQFSEVDYQWLEVVTNADYLTRDRIESLFESGCTDITVSMYDRDLTEEINLLSKNIDINIHYKKCYETPFLDGLVDKDSIIRQDNPLSIERPCYIPFYKMQIDWNGEVMLCHNDWGRNAKGFGNVNKNSIKDIWLGKKFFEYRNMLSNNKRDTSPCVGCNINGTKYGSESFNFFNSKSVIV